MKIVDIGICIDNLDPKGIGRIRYRPYGLFKSEIEKAISYEKWDDNDQFIAIPFLPLHINVIPQIRQSVKLIKYDTDKDTQNVEYVSGPYATPHDFESETFIAQHKNTTYGGVIVQDRPDVRDAKTGEYIDKKSNGSIANINDIGLYGNYGSDIIFTQNGINLRGGKFVTKNVKNKTVRQRIQEVPYLSEKIAKLNLKKFPYTMTAVDSTTEETIVTVSKIKYVIEYSIDDLTTPTKLDVYIYKILDNTLYDTNTFNESTDLDSTKIKLISVSGETISISKTLTNAPVENRISNAASEMRDILYTIDQDNLNDLNSDFENDNVFPYFFRPTTEFKTRITTPTENTNRSNFINNVKIRKNAVGNSLIFSKTSITPTVTTVSKKVKELKLNQNSGEQTFASLSADQIYFLSTNVNKGPLYQSINFNKLDPYEYAQEDYLKNISPYTYSFVRGEVLIDILTLMHEILTNHVHNINKPAIYEEGKETQLQSLIKNMKNDLINKSLRIN